jgi:hypothetical protein
MKKHTKLLFTGAVLGALCVLIIVARPADAQSTPGHSGRAGSVTAASVGALGACMEDATNGDCSLTQIISINQTSGTPASPLLNLRTLNVPSGTQSRFASIGTQGSEFFAFYTDTATGGRRLAVTGNTTSFESGTATNDYACVSGQTCRFASVGSANAQIQSGSELIDLVNSAGSVIGQISMANAAGPQFQLGTGGNDGFIRAQDASNGGVLTSNVSNITATVRIATMGDSTAQFWGLYGEGLVASESAQTCNCGTAGTPNTVTCDITSKVVRLTDGDADACTVTIDDATATTIDRDLDVVTIIVDSDGGGGAFNIAEVANELQLKAGASFAAGTGDMLFLVYVAGALDTWQELDRSDI